MVLTITKNQLENAGSVMLATGLMSFDDSYPTGGEPLVAANFGLDKIISVQIQSSDGFVFEYDYANGKVIAFYADYDAVADGALIQVADTTDLEAITNARYVVFGRV